MLADIPLPNLPGNVDNWQGSVDEKVNYWNFSQRVDLNFSDRFKVFARVGVFKADLYQDNPLGSGAGFFPLSGSNRDGMSFAGDAVWVISEPDDAQRARQLLQHDRRVLQPVAAARRRKASPATGRTTGTRRSTTAATSTIRRSTSPPARAPTTNNRLGRQGREWYQHPDAWTLSARMNRYAGRAQPEVGRRDPRLLRRGRALRADQPRLQLGAHRQQLRQPAGRHHRQPVGHVPARRARQPDLGAARAAPDDQPARLLGLLPGRLARQRSADAEPRSPLGVRAGRDRSATTGCRRGSISPSRFPRCRRRRRRCRRRPRS